VSALSEPGQRQPSEQNAATNTLKSRTKLMCNSGLKKARKEQQAHNSKNTTMRNQAGKKKNTQQKHGGRPAKGARGNTGMKPNIYAYILPHIVARPSRSSKGCVKPGSTATPFCTRPSSKGAICAVVSNWRFSRVHSQWTMMAL